MTPELYSNIYMAWRQRRDMQLARTRLELQAQARCRAYCEGDKEKAAKLWGLVKKDSAEIMIGHEDALRLSVALRPYILGMVPFNDEIKRVEKQLTVMIRQVPLWNEWGKGVVGLGEISFAGLLGEAGVYLTSFKSDAALWKRFGLAVIGDQRQRKVADAELAILHGYSPTRRSYAYVISTGLLRSGRVAQAKGQQAPYCEIYDRRKAYELERGIPKAHAHNRAMRVMVKKFLRDAYNASKRMAA